MTIIHVLADGTIKDKIDGHVVKPETTPELYRVLERLSKKEVKK